MLAFHVAIKNPPVADAQKKIHMKLFTKYNRINIIASILIFLGGCIAFYFVMDHILVKQLDEALEVEQSEIVQYTKQHNKLPEIVNTNDQQTYILETTRPVPSTVYAFKKKLNKEDELYENIRQIIFGLEVAGKHYQVTVNKSQEGMEDFLKLLVLVAAIMIALILLAGYIINRMVLKSLWQPFYSSIEKISSYQLQQQQALQLPTTNIEEFDLLNNAMNNMVSRAEQDYRILKEFTGNAAHEIQTPLAVISTNTESLMQDEAILERHHATITTIEDAAKRLSRLNQSLLLLTKIENHRFELNEHVQWDQLIAKRLEELNALADSQNLLLMVNTVPVTTLFHQHLASILVSNLLGNAIRYNYENGLVQVQLNENSFTVSNTSSLPKLDSEKVFNRFYRHPETKVEGSGLGLSIVQQLCKAAGYRLSYTYDSNNKLHVFSIQFS